jgi:hypothetical protein
MNVIPELSPKLTFKILGTDLEFRLVSSTKLLVLMFSVTIEDVEFRDVRVELEYTDKGWAYTKSERSNPNPVLVRSSWQKTDPAMRRRFKKAVLELINSRSKEIESLRPHAQLAYLKHSIEKLNRNRAPYVRALRAIDDEITKLQAEADHLELEIMMDD